MLALAPDADAAGLARTTPSTVGADAASLTTIAGTRIPSRARSPLLAALIASQEPQPSVVVLPDPAGHLLGVRRMATRIRFGPARAGLSAPRASRTTKPLDQAVPFASSFTTTASITSRTS